MVISKNMNKPSLKISVSDHDSSSTEENEEVEDESNEENSQNGTLITNEGWADSITKILGSTKPKNKKTLVLSRAKKHSQLIKSTNEEKPAFEIIGEGNETEKEVKKEVLPSEPPEKKLKHEKSSIRIKPNILEKDRERLLSKIATKGVVQLFNAVRNQQKSLDQEMNRKDLPETKKEKIIKKFDKRAFLDTLMGQTKSIVVDEVTKTSDVKEEDNKPKWNALRDDFMMGAKMKDWDKESVEE
ncbi:RRP15-like protein [Achroia grisella]|uniref:RRP15-like protein n=1 Tax=Achroia grisella TaxID=688607 RepID=UPI0027D20342|nr:RRP15-like protein [Achroia grisella]